MAVCHWRTFDSPKTNTAWRSIYTPDLFSMFLLVFNHSHKIHCKNTVKSKIIWTAHLFCRETMRVSELRLKSEHCSSGVCTERRTVVPSSGMLINGRRGRCRSGEKTRSLRKSKFCSTDEDTRHNRSEVKAPGRFKKRMASGGPITDLLK